MKTHARCPNPVDVERAYWSTRGSGEPAARDAALHAHVSGCAECTAQWNEIAVLAGAGRQLEPSPAAWDRREDIRTTILSRVELATPRPRFTWSMRWLTPLALAAAALVAWFAWPGGSAPPAAVGVAHRAVVLEHATARHLVVSAMPDEIVRLVDGTITVTITPLAAGERFRVITGDGEVEAANAAFDVTARGDRLISARAIHGVVKLLAAGTTITLRAGEIWRSSTELAAAPATANAATAPANATAPSAQQTVPASGATTSIAMNTATAGSPARSSAPGRTPARPTAIADAADRPSKEARSTAAPLEDIVPVEIADAEVSIAAPAPAAPRSMGQQAFDEGWVALRGGDFPTASKAFERALAVTTDPRTTEDAAFWRGVALARAGEIGTAAHVFVAFLAAYPGSPRAGEAHVMLGWLLFERGDTVEAGRHFDRGAGDSSSRVRDSAAAGQRAVSGRAK